eukprot:scpid99095/ scgid22188/ Cytochrome b561 domain-containing protein 1
MYTVILQAIGLATAAWIAYLSQPGSSLFSWHPTLMSFAFLVAMPNGIFALSRNHPLYASAKLSSKVTIHLLSQLVAVSSALIALATIITNKDNNKADHFTTRHGLIGLITCIAMVGATSGGVLANNTQLVKAFIKPAAMKSIHAFAAGCAVYPLAMTTIVLATYSNFLVSALPIAYMRYTIAGVATIMAVAVYVQVSQRGARKTVRAD